MRRNDVHSLFGDVMYEARSAQLRLNKKKIYFFSVNTVKILISCNGNFIFSLVLRTCENPDVFITLDENIYGIHSKRVNIFYLFLLLMKKKKKKKKKTF